MKLHRKRITKGEDFKHIVRKGIRVGGQYVVAHAVLSSQETPRVGFIVSKRIGNAVQRNLVRRRLVGITYENGEQISDKIDIVFRTQPGAATAKYAQLEAEVLGQAQKLQSRMKL